EVFPELLQRCAAFEPLPVAVCQPASDVALGGVVEAVAANLIKPICVGDRAAIEKIAAEQGFDINGFEIIDKPDDEAAAQYCVDLCSNGTAHALMKGSLHTDVMMHAVMHSALRGARRLSHVFVMDAPAYAKPLLITDAAVNIQPALDDKVDILKNAIELAHALDIDKPKVAILSAVETVNPKIASTIDAAALCKMADRKQIEGAILDGPLAFDTAISAEAARIKGLRSDVAGDVDILLVPDLESGNMLAKQLEYLGGAKNAGIVLGASVPIILTSRADSAEDRLASCAVAVMYARWRNRRT
ncbi:MAG TPA: bifunctional enoyl-CoA hydratase/phosphate acetyltransferase, partial [Spongiibacteraceae bacterium]|nr:bifunctional enoyl-CoA hydratase/phosphate acetyltransferase [Spongiibacteraceae bacterium]